MTQPRMTDSSRSSGRSGGASHRAACELARSRNVGLGPPGDSKNALSCVCSFRGVRPFVRRFTSLGVRLPVDSPTMRSSLRSCSSRPPWPSMMTRCVKTRAVATASTPPKVRNLASFSPLARE